MEGRHAGVRDELSPPRLGWLVVFAVFALLCYNAGPVVEQIHYAWQRGRLRAEAENAAWRLDELAKRDVSDTALTFPLVVQRVSPCVVQIDTLQPAPKLETGKTDRPRQLAGQGAGVILDEAGYILTNYHVIRGATSVHVRLSDGRHVRRVEVTGIDPQTDLAVLKIDADGLIAAKWGDSDQLEIGEWVLALGNPFRLERSVSAGIISAKHRRNIVQNHGITYQDFLQIDATINRGNSGGPVVNIHGEVVGIATAIVGDYFQGVGFAIPSSIAREVYGRLKSSGKFERGLLGVRVQNLTAETADRLQIPRKGVWVTSVERDSPAWQSGIRMDDVVIDWNGQAVNDFRELRLEVARTPIGSEAKVTIRRGENTMTLKVTVGRRRDP